MSGLLHVWFPGHLLHGPSLGVLWIPEIEKKESSFLGFGILLVPKSGGFAERMQVWSTYGDYGVLVAGLTGTVEARKLEHDRQDK